jgi:Tol biopolymer transport system component
VPRAITFPQAPAYDADPAFSPEGRALAYASCRDLAVPVCNVNVLSLDAGLQPAGASRRLPGPPVWVQGVTWTRDGRSIVYGGGVGQSPSTYLWRVLADGGAAPERVELAGRGATTPSIARGRDRLAFARTLWDADIYRLQQGAPPAPLLASTFGEVYPQYSPDGRRVAFQSGRSGDAIEIWLADADGSGVTRLTRGPGTQGTPRWSPDGRTIAFDSQNAEGRVDVWAIGVDGAGLRQVTRDPANDNMPSWSRDGRFLYYGSNRTGRFEIWRVPVAGGAEEQLTREGGCVPFESGDGRTLYYMRSCSNDALLARPAGGGIERMIFRCVDEKSWAVGPKGIFHVDCKSLENPLQHVVRHWNAATGQDRPIGTFEAAWTAGLTVSPDGRSILYGRSMMDSDLLMIDNFR